jgi:hypothetical protein
MKIVFATILSAMLVVPALAQNGLLAQAGKHDDIDAKVWTNNQDVHDTKTGHAQARRAQGQPRNRARAGAAVTPSRPAPK